MAGLNPTTPWLAGCSATPMAASTARQDGVLVVRDHAQIVGLEGPPAASVTVGGEIGDGRRQQRFVGLPAQRDQARRFGHLDNVRGKFAFKQNGGPVRSVHQHFVAEVTQNVPGQLSGVGKIRGVRIGEMFVGVNVVVGGRTRGRP